jgi:uncharacterized protein (DUF885 family)
MFRPAIRLLLIAAGCVFQLLPFALALSCYAADLSGHDKLNALIDREWQHRLREFPEQATMTGDRRFNDRLTDFSAAAFERRAEHDRAALAEFRTISPAGLAAEDKLNLALMQYQLQVSVDGARFRAWEMEVNQMDGPALDYASLPQEMPFATAADYENYLKRLRVLPRVLEQTTTNMRLGMRDGLMPPRYLLEVAAAQAAEIAAKPVEQSLFTEPLKRFPDGVGARDRKRIAEEMNTAVRALVLPAYAKFARFVQDEYAPRGRTEPGVDSLPDGAARYRQCIREQTTTDISPEELHALGLKQVAELDAQMLSLARAQGFADLKSFNRHIREDRGFYGKSGEQVLNLYAKYTDQMYAKLPSYFSKLPKTRLVVMPMEDFRSANAVPADYSNGAGDGSRPGRINVNQYDPAHRLLLNSEAIAYHEGIPGHHLQISLAQETQNIPAFRRYGDYTSYVEGWALYAETLAHEMGFYQDPYSEYGRLQNLMWRSIRLVVDTGVHSQHWTRKQMIDFFHEHTAMDEQNISSEVDRYIAWPGQALSYKLGEMTILRARSQAQEKLKERFDIRAFHAAVLDAGPLPLSLLEQKLRDWLTGQ